MRLFKKRLLPNKLFRIYLPVAIAATALAVTALEVTNKTDFFRRAAITDKAPVGATPSNLDASDPAKAAKDPDAISSPKKSSQDTPTSTGGVTQKTKVTPEITYATQERSGQPIEVRGFVPQIYEDGGTCLATFTRGTQSVSKSSTGFKNVSYTTCPTITLARSSFPSSGDWTLILSYKSATSEGSSQSQVIKVQ